MGLNIVTYNNANDIGIYSRMANSSTTFEQNEVYVTLDYVSTPTWADMSHALLGKQARM